MLSSRSNGSKILTHIVKTGVAHGFGLHLWQFDTSYNFAQALKYCRSQRMLPFWNLLMLSSLCGANPLRLHNRNYEIVTYHLLPADIPIPWIWNCCKDRFRFSSMFYYRVYIHSLTSMHPCPVHMGQGYSGGQMLAFQQPCIFRSSHHHRSRCSNAHASDSTTTDS